MNLKSENLQFGVNHETNTAHAKQHSRSTDASSGISTHVSGLLSCLTTHWDLEPEQLVRRVSPRAPRFDSSRGGALGETRPTLWLTERSLLADEPSALRPHAGFTLIELL